MLPLLTPTQCNSMKVKEKNAFIKENAIISVKLVDRFDQESWIHEGIAALAVLLLVVGLEITNAFKNSRFKPVSRESSIDKAP